MSTNLDDLNIGGQLQVGTGIPPAIKQGDEKINGSMHVEGPAVFGGPIEFDHNLATLMVGRTKNDDPDCEPADRSVYVKGNTVIEGDDGTDEALNVSGDVVISGDGEISGNWTIGGTMKSNYATWDGSIVATTKLFDIQHPSKDGHRLAHGCLEGPEHAVYARGRVCNGKNVIDLPEYWSGLVDFETLTVQLTSIGSHQNVIVKRISPMERKIYLQAQGGMPVDAFYHIMAERIDSDKLVVEYEGNSVEDSPNE